MRVGGLSEPINHKLGPLIHSWSIPAGPTCPGESNLCRSKCYAMRGYFVYPKTKLFLQRNWDFSRTADFVPWMVGTLKGQPVRTMRIHVSGDFYDVEYVAKWQEIIAANKRLTFFAYTRSWREASCVPALIELAQLPNCCLWFSVDRETGPAPLVHGIRRAYMAINDVDASTAPDDCDLVFRHNPRTPMKRANGVLVCPTENGVPGKLRHTCTTCGICWNKQRTTRWEELLPLLAGDMSGIEINAPEAPC